MSILDAGVDAISLALSPTGQTLEGATDNVILNTATVHFADGSEGIAGDVALLYQPGRRPRITDRGRARDLSGPRHERAAAVLDAGVPSTVVERHSVANVGRLVQAMAGFGGDRGAAPVEPRRPETSEPLMLAASRTSNAFSRHAVF